MFTGLVRTIGIIKNIREMGGYKRLEISVPDRVISVQVGSSVACSGCCLTVVEIVDNTLFFDVSKESLNKTTIGSWSVNDRVNIEPSLRPQDEMGGHFVSGHIDSTLKIQEIRNELGSYIFGIVLPQNYKKYIASKGCVALDGISLTVNDVQENLFYVNIIPHTLGNTTLCDRHVGDFLNFEIDLLARYMARMLEVGGHD